MANDNEIKARGGLLPVQYPFGNYRRTLYKATTHATLGFYIGTPVDLDSDGQATFGGAGDLNPLLGSVVGWVDTNKAGTPSITHDLDTGAYLPANKDAYLVVADDPEQFFSIQEDTGGSALTQSAVGNIATFSLDTDSGSTVTGYSTAQFDRSDIATDTGGNLQLIGLVDKMNSDGSLNTWGNYAKLLVRIAKHRLGPITDAANVPI